MDCQFPFAESALMKSCTKEPVAAPGFDRPSSTLQSAAGNMAIQRRARAGTADVTVGKVHTENHAARAQFAGIHTPITAAQPKGEDASKTPDEHDVNGPLTNPRFVGDQKLEQVAAGKGIVAVGSFRPAVARIQRALMDLGFDLPKHGVDCDFGGETQKAVHDFQEQQEARLREGAVGKETIHLLDQAAPRKEFESPLCPERKQPAKKEAPPKYEGPCRFIVEDHEFSDADCREGCGGGKIIEWARIRAEGSDCPADLSGKKFDERVLPISNTCPGGMGQGLLCETAKDGTIHYEGGPCLDRYRVCPTFDEVRRSPSFSLLPTYWDCVATVRQVLMFDGEPIKMRIISVRVSAWWSNPFAIECSATVTYTK